MGMKLTNSMEEVKNNFRSSYAAAMREGSEENMVACLEEFSQGICESMLSEYAAMSAEERSNSEILAARGVRQLTSEEVKYYKAVSDAMKSNIRDVKSALTDIKVTMPETVIDQVMEDVKSEFPLLDAIDFVNSTYMTTWIYNKQGVQTASWGTIGGSITKELNGAFGKISATACKLSAYMVVSQDYLDLGPAWLDRYIRAILTEASGMAMEAAIVNGAGNSDGADCPIGMTKDLDKGTTDAGTGLITYADKSKTAVTALDPETYGAIVAKLAKTATGRYRRVGDLIMVVNPEDYFTKILPATTYLTPGGGYVHDVLPYPTQIIQSEGCPSGTAVVGLAKQYIGLLGVGTKNGTITYDDSVQFLEDNRVYKLRLLGNGKPKDNTSFEVLDISGLKPLTYTITQG